MTTPNHSTIYKPGQTVASFDANRWIQLIRNGIMQFPSGLANSLQDQIGMEELTPGLRDFLTSLVANVAGFNKASFVGDGSTAQFLLASIPSAGSELVYHNGDLLDGADYTFQEILGLPYLVTEEIPAFGDKIVVVYRTSNTLNPAIIGAFNVHHHNISAVFDGNSVMVMLGKRTDAPTGVHEVFKVNVVDMSLPAQIPVAVDSIPNSERDWPEIVKCGNYVWAIGDSGTGLNTITKIDVNTLASTGFALTTDAAATITAIATDNSYIYAFMKHSTYTYPNSFIKVAQDGTVSGLIYSGLTVTGKVATCVSNNGYLYASFDDPSVKQVRKYDTSPTNGFKKSFSFIDAPTALHPVDTYIYVLNGKNLHRISAISDTVTLLQIYSFTPTQIHYDGSGLWIASNDVLYKCDKLGNILQTITPEGGQNIREIHTSFAFLWTTYIDEASNINITKLYPGLPNV